MRIDLIRADIAQPVEGAYGVHRDGRFCGPFAPSVCGTVWFCGNMRTVYRDGSGQNRCHWSDIVAVFSRDCTLAAFGLNPDGTMKESGDAD